MQSYYLYSALLALKLLALAPLAAIVCNQDKVMRANISDLKHLTPFWIVAALYMTTLPDQATTLALLRLFVGARFVAALGYITRLPKFITEAAFFMSFAVTSYMAGCVVYTYRNAL